MPMQVRFTNAPRLQVRAVQLPGSVDSVFGRRGAVVAANSDYTASQVTNVPSGSVTAVTVQAAIDQLATGAGVVGAALTKTDDTNVTATLGGTPLTALLRATSVTLGWTGTLAVSRGGTGTSTLASHGVLIGAGTGTIAQLAEAGSGTVLTGVASSNPAFTTTVQLGVPGVSLGQLVLSGNTSGTITIQGQAAAGTFNFNLPITAGVSGQPLLSGGGGATAQTYGTLTVSFGGTGTGTWATNTVIIGGATATGTFQQVASGVSGTFLMSQGPGVLPTYASPGAVTTLVGTDSRLQNVGFTCSVTSSSLTITLTGANGSAPTAGNEVVIDFRSQTGTIANFSSMTLTASSSLTISSGSTLGVTSATAFRIWIVGFNDAGTFRLGAINCSAITAIGGATSVGNVASVFSLNDGLASSTAEGGAGAADSAGVIYAGAAVTAKPMRILGYAEWNSSGVAASGTWTLTNLSSLQVFGPGIKKPGDIIQTVTASTITAANTTSNVYSATNLSANIVPTSAADLIRCSASGNLQNDNTTSLTAAGLIFGRNSNANLFGARAANFGLAVGVRSGANIFGWDKPNTTSSTTYGPYLASTGNTGTVSFPETGVPAFMEVSEIMS